MRDIIHQYGRTVLICFIVSSVLFLVFGGKRSLYAQISDGIKKEPPLYVDAAETASKTALQKSSARFIPKTSLKPNTRYRINQLVEPAPSEKATATGGKALKVLRLYDGPAGKQELVDISDTCLSSSGKNIVFPSRGLYLLTVSVRDDTPRSALQYVYVFIEGDLSV